ncbi:hypothetical protein [uncultured Parvibaculum sp.]|uniref:hypothetical protein n=1 Tax=uncultured Parvibaculum sp. TaxID=291828 RepID=UPI0030EF9675|tara:strand:- start:21291 stop:21605 length:315 start_codon:yes stop_codon:yes gene_type:complete
MRQFSGILFAVLIAGLAGPAMAGERVQWIDPWADEELAGGGETPANGRIDITGQVQSFGFHGGVERRFIFIPASAGFGPGHAMPAGQRSVTGDSVRPFRPQPRF